MDNKSLDALFSGLTVNETIAKHQLSNLPHNVRKVPSQKHPEPNKRDWRKRDKKNASVLS